MGNRVFKVFDGGPGGAHSATYINASAIEEGETSGGGDGGGNVPSILKLDVRRDIQWMKVLWGLLIPALAWFLIYFVSEMKDVRKSIADVDKNVAGQTTAIGDIQRSLDRIESRLDERHDTQSQAGSGTGQAGTVHSGAGVRPKPRG